MPQPGDQYGRIENPFVESMPRISEYTAMERIALKNRLNQQLGPEYISKRSGPSGSTFHYLAGDKAINLANEVFGFNGWNSAIRNVQVDFLDVENGKVSMGLSIICRVTLKDGTFHEDIGYGEIKNAPSKGAAFEKTKKEASTDALKRALRNFGNVLGMCLYDKDYLQRVSRLKPPPSRWDPENLHRHPHYGSLKGDVSPPGEELKVIRRTSMQSADMNGQGEDEYGGNAFDEVDFLNPDEVCLDEIPSPGRQGIRRKHSNDICINTHAVQGPGPPDAPQTNGPQPNQAPRLQSGISDTNQRRPQPANTTQHATKSVNPTTWNVATPRVDANQQHRGQSVTTSAHQQQTVQPKNQPTQLTNATPSRQVSNPPQTSGMTNQGPANGIQEQRSANAIQVHTGQPSRNANTIQRNEQPTVVNGNGVGPANTTKGMANTAVANGNQATGSGPPPTHQPPVGFYSSRAAGLFTDENNLPTATSAHAFDPHAAGQMRRTQGFNHNRSAPVSRQAITTNANQAASNGSNPTKPNFVNPQADGNRRIGMPGGGVPTPLLNRTSYKPPGPAPIKRNAESMSRSALNDVSNNLPAAVPDAPNPKRPKVESDRSKEVAT